MGYYMIRARFSQAALQGLVAKPQDRKKAVTKLVEARGGKLRDYFFAFGDKDMVIIMEAPSHEDAMAVAMTGAAAGTITDCETTVLIPSSDAMGAMKKAGAAAGVYKAPVAR